MNSFLAIIAAAVALVFTGAIMSAMFSPSFVIKIRALLLCDMILVLGVPAMDMWEEWRPVEHPDLSPELQKLKTQYGMLFDSPAITGVAVVILLLTIASWILIYRRSQHAPRIFLFRIFVTFLYTVCSGPTIMGPWGSGIGYVQVLIEGVLLGLIVTTVAEMDDLKANEQGGDCTKSLTE